MEVEIITQGANLERQLKIKKKKIKENALEYNQKKEIDSNENKIEINSDNNSSSDEDELISFTSNYDLIKQNKKHDLNKNDRNDRLTKNEAFEKLVDANESKFIYLFVYYLFYLLIISHIIMKVKCFYIM